MGAVWGGKSGMTLAVREGSAGLSQGRWGYTISRAALVFVAAAAFVAGLAATSAVLFGGADPGVVPGAPGETVQAVSPTGFAWREGIRAGQIVRVASRADDPDGWHLETFDGTQTHVADARAANDGLRASLPLALAALFLGGLAVVLLGTRRSLVVCCAATALVFGAHPLALQGNPVLSTLAMAAAVATVAGWVLARVPAGRLGSVLAAALVGAIAYWAAARLNGLPGYEELEWVRGVSSTVGAGTIIVGRLALPRLAGEPIRVIRPRALDVAAVGGLAAIGLTLIYLFAAPTLFVVGLVMGGLLLLPSVRRQFRPIEDALLADVRKQAAAQGAEAERARLARELHDVPLQELLGILRRLESNVDVADASDDLRAVTGQIRNFAMDLRPPVLDDLGLPAALQYLRDETASDLLPVEVRLDDHTGVARPDRPPEDVELAMYRIAAEAVTNAIRHAQAAHIQIHGAISPKRVELEVSDDGLGIAADVLRAGRRGKQMGLASMRRRAEAIDADLTIKNTSNGTLVRVLWER
jgi:signal transduction histidine kinase